MSRVKASERHLGLDTSHFLATSDAFRLSHRETTDASGQTAALGWRPDDAGRLSDQRPDVYSRFHTHMAGTACLHLLAASGMQQFRW